MNKKSSGNFHESFSMGDVPPPSERSTGLVFAAVAAIIAILWRENTTVLATAGLISAGFLTVSLTRPMVLRPLNLAWFKLALFLNKIVSPVVMFVLFAVVIVPFGVIMQLRSDPLRRRARRDTNSFWIERGADQDKTSMVNQF